MRAHFRDRPGDFAELCAFLGREAPALPFPHTRTANPRHPARRTANYLLRSLGI